MMRVILIAVAVFSLLLGGCAGHQGVVLLDGKAYVLLEGACEGVSFQADDNEPVQVAGDCNDSKYSLAPGRHVLRLYRNGELILERLVYLESSETCEVTVP